MLKIKNIVVYIILLLSLSSCDGPDTWCWQSGADSYADDSITTQVANNLEIWAFSAPYENYPGGYGIWVNTGFNVTGGANYTITVPSGTGDQIITAPAYQSTANNGLGEPYTILASNGTPTLIDDDGAEVVFSTGQDITITIEACSTESESYGTTSPTKWTWDNNWRYQTVMCTACAGGNTGNNTDNTCVGLSQCTSYAPPTNGSSPLSTCATTTTAGPDCIAYIGCQNCTGNCPVTTSHTCSYNINTCPFGFYLTTSDTGTTCGGYASWGCSHVSISFDSDAVPYIYGMNVYNSSGVETNSGPENYDVCPTVSYPASDTLPPENLYICQFQDGELSGESAYASTYPPFVGSGSGDWISSPPPSANNAQYCDNYTNYDPCSFSSYWSNSYPGSMNSSDSPGNWPSNYSHCGDSDTTEQSSQVIHMTGNVDTCWNTGGYQLFAIQNGVQCPPSPLPPAAPTTNADCLSVWTQNVGTTGYTSDGNGNMIYNTVFNFSALGGPLWLAIINPNSPPPASVSDLQTDISTNNTAISEYNSNNANLYPTLTNQLVSVDSYYTSGTIETLIQQGDGLSATGDISDSTAQQYMTNILNLMDGYQPSTGAFVNGIYESFTTLNTLLNQTDPAFEPDDTTSWEPYIFPTSYSYYPYPYPYKTPPPPNYAPWAPTSYPGQTVSSNIYDLSGNTILAAQTLITYLTPTTTYTPPTLTGATTSTDLINYCNSLISTLQSVQESIYTAETTQSQIDYNNAQITNLTNENNEYNTEILNSNSFDNSGMVGGYTAYVAAGPLTASYGLYLKAIVVPDNEDPNAALTNADENPDLYYTIFDYSNSTGYPLLNPLTFSPPAQTTSPSQSGTVWMKIYDPDGNYYNNSGSYVVDFALNQTTSGFSTMMTNIISLIKNTIQNTAKAIYLGTTCYNTGQDRDTGLCMDYITSIHIILNMYVVIFGIMYLFGLIKTDYVDFVMRIVKIAIVIMLLQPNSFDFFNQYFFSGFYGLSNTLISAATGAPSNNPFDFLTQSVNVLLLDQTTYFKIIGLLFQGLLGIVAFILMVYGAVSFAIAIFDAFIMYMTSFIGMGLCIALAPIYIIFILFESTSHLFENWFKAMVQLTLVPVILFIGLIIINGMLGSILESALNYDVCFKCTMPFTFAIPGFSQVGNTTLFCVSWFSKWGSDNVGSATNVALMTFPLALNFCILSEVMRVYSGKLALQVAGGIVGSSSLFNSRDSNASLGANPFKGLQNNLKYMDKTAEKLAVRTGIANDKEEYKGMRNRALKKGAVLALKISAASGVFGAIGAANQVFSSKKKELSPTSINANKPLSLSDQMKAAANKHEQINKKLSSANLSKTQRKKLNKQANKAKDKFDTLKTRQSLETSSLDSNGKKQYMMEAQLLKQASQARDRLNNYMRLNSENQHDPKVAKTIEKLRELDDKASQKLNDFRDKTTKESTKPQDSSGKPQDSSGKPQDSSGKPQDSSSKPQNNSEKPKGSPEKDISDKDKAENKTYETLGLKKEDLLAMPLDQQERTLNSNYRKLSRIHHPDKGGSVEKMKELNNAKTHADEMLEKRKIEGFAPIAKPSSESSTSAASSPAKAPTETPKEPAPEASPPAKPVTDNKKTDSISDID